MNGGHKVLLAGLPGVGRAGPNVCGPALTHTVRDEG